MTPSIQLGDLTYAYISALPVLPLPSHQLRLAKSKKYSKAAMAANSHRIVPLLLVALFLIAQLAPAAACPHCPKPKPPPPPPPKVKPPPSSVPCPPPPATPTPTPSTPPYTPSPTGKCPINTLKLLACVDVLNGLVHAVVGASASEACCPLLSGVADLDAALCLCTTIKAKALSVSLVLPIAIEVLVNECGKHVPSSFQCP